MEKHVFKIANKCPKNYRCFEQTKACTVARYKNTSITFYNPITYYLLYYGLGIQMKSNIENSKKGSSNNNIEKVQGWSLGGVSVGR